MVNKNGIEMEELKHHHRHFDSENENVFKILEQIKNSIQIFKNLAMNKFRKVVDLEIGKILEELNLARIDKETTLIGFFDMNISIVKNI